VCLLKSQNKVQGGESPMVRAASTLPQNRRKKAVGGGRGIVGCPMLWQQKPPPIALVNCYVDLPPLDEFDRTERVGSRHDVGIKHVAPERASSGRGQW
jgi:hypothetical protein